MRKCPFCKNRDLKPVKNTSSLYYCSHCRRRYYVSVCWSCHAVIFKVDTEKNHCPACNWYFCDSCHSCSPGCSGVDESTDYADDPTNPMPDYTADEVAAIFDEAQQNFPDYTADDLPPADDADDVRLEDEIPFACWQEWSEEDPSAYAE